MSQPAKALAKERLLLILLAAVNFTHIMDFMIMMPLGNYLMPHFGINTQEFSWLVSAYTYAAFLSSLAMSFVADRFDRKQVLLVAYCGFLLGTLGCALAPTFGFLLGARIFAGLFGGLIGAQVMSIVADTVPYERRASAMGIIMSAFSLASAFGVPFGLYIATHLSWHAPFVAVVGMGAVVAPLLAYYLPAMNKHLSGPRAAGNPWAVITGVLTDPNQRLAIGLMGLLFMGHFLIIPFLNPYMELNMGFPKEQSLMIYVVGGVATFFASPIIGRIADKSGKVKLFTIMAVLSLIPIAVITNLRPMPLVFVLIITGFWFVCSTGRSIPVQAMVSNIVPPERRGGFMSFNASASQLFTGTASLLAGYIVRKSPDGKLVHYNVTGYISIAIILLCMAMAWRLHYVLQRRERLTRPEEQAVQKESKESFPQEA